MILLAFYLGLLVVVSLIFWSPALGGLLALALLASFIFTMAREKKL